ncbi:ArsR family transcriptional regulator [Sphingobacterium sp. lm-10]|uniref:ArsR/SmtB family transcription factor n=1 Tax=Sphingobacterium sp. lm-10 TaxID=2944904 RepID=UPI0020229A6F|nr:helix-turn-helix transcriptional regulator [Sphingobacterium sp. lm-10]MCL7987840.1 ArsR family transcriptional regulator [Sphingobacterium sp. lm-10]
MDRVKVFKALSNQTRLDILNWLKAPAEHFPHQSNADFEVVGVCVGQIQAKTGLSQSTVSEYLSILQRADLVIASRVGQWTYYKRNKIGLENLSKIVNTEL